MIVGPDGTVLHQAGIGHEIMPVEIDLETVRRSRRRGLLGLGQVLKSFRDTAVQFSPYLDGPAQLRVAAGARTDEHARTGARRRLMDLDQVVVRNWPYGVGQGSTIFRVESATVPKMTIIKGVKA